MASTQAFTLYPLTYDPTTQNLDSNVASIQTELAKLNSLHKLLLSDKETQTTQIPPPPVPVKPTRSAAIDRLRKTGNEHFKKGAYGEAVRHYTFGIEMALSRPPWEPAGLVRDELHVLYANRSQAHMGVSNWPEGLADAEMSVEMRKGGNMKGHWRKARCLKEMGRLEEAREALEYGLEFGEDTELNNLKREVEELLAKKEKK